MKIAEGRAHVYSFVHQSKPVLYYPYTFERNCELRRAIKQYSAILNDNLWNVIRCLKLFAKGIYINIIGANLERMYSTKYEVLII